MALLADGLPDLSRLFISKPKPLPEPTGAAQEVYDATNDDRILAFERVALNNDLDLAEHIHLLYGQVRLDPAHLTRREHRKAVEDVWAHVNTDWEDHGPLLSPAVIKCITELVTLARAEQELNANPTGTYVISTVGPAVKVARNAITRAAWDGDAAAKTVREHYERLLATAVARKKLRDLRSRLGQVVLPGGQIWYDPRVGDSTTYANPDDALRPGTDRASWEHYPETLVGATKMWDVYDAVVGALYYELPDALEAYPGHKDYITAMVDVSGIGKLFLRVRQDLNRNTWIRYIILRAEDGTPQRLENAKQYFATRNYKRQYGNLVMSPTMFESYLAFVWASMTPAQQQAYTVVWRLHAPQVGTDGDGNDA